MRHTECRVQSFETREIKEALYMILTLESCLRSGSQTNRAWKITPETTSVAEHLQVTDKRQEPQQGKVIQSTTD